MNTPDTSPPPLRDAALGTDLGSLEGAARRQRGLGEHTILAYRRTWARLLAWSATAAPRHAPALDPRFLSSEQAARCYAEAIAAPGRTAPASLIQARAALAFAFEQWDAPNPFARIRPPRGAGVAPAVAYLGAPELARLLEALRVPTAGARVTYNGSVVFYLAATLFYTAARYAEIASLRWSDCLWSSDGSRPAVLRIRAKGGSHHDLPVNAALGALLAEWRPLQEQFKGMKAWAGRGLAFCRSEVIFAGPGGTPLTNQAFNGRLAAACRALRLPCVLSAHGLRHSAATLLLNAQGRNLREVQEVLRHKDIRTTARYTHIHSERTRATLESLGASLPVAAAQGISPPPPQGPPPSPRSP